MRRPSDSHVRQFDAVFDAFTMLTYNTETADCDARKLETLGSVHAQYGTHTQPRRAENHASPTAHSLH